VSLKLFLQKFHNIFSKRIPFILLAVFLVGSCADDGCIEADDFGEYESQTLEVSANAAQESCDFNHSEDLEDTFNNLTDSSQGSGIKNCLTGGDVTISDEDSNVLVSTAGCYGLDEAPNPLNLSLAKFRNLCVNQCVQSCNANQSGGSINAEPDWVSTSEKEDGKNIGVTIRPGARITIRAVGSVSLGATLPYPNLFVQADNPDPHSKDVNWYNTYLDVRKNQSMFVKFSGHWEDGADATKPAENLGDASADMTAANATRLINGARRLVAYVIPHPTNYLPNPSGSAPKTEKNISSGVPLLPDPNVWECNYDGSDLLESTCENSREKGYSISTTSASYTNFADVDEELSRTTFPLSGTYRTTTLGTYGGMIRWDNDGIYPQEEDPFASNNITCNGVTGNCDRIEVVTNSGRGFIMGDISAAETEIPNDSGGPVRLSIKSLTGNTSCNITLNLSIRDSSSALSLDSAPNLSSVDVLDTQWTTEDITLENGHKLVIAQNTDDYPAGVNCGRSIAIKKTRYHDIIIDSSGFVKFTSLRGTDHCDIKTRIINPEGTRENPEGTRGNPGGSHFDVNNDYTSDFYETDFVNTAVPASPATGSLAWSPRMFVRKGQIIRFSPESWDDEWTTSPTSSKRRCGVGMAMLIDHRPALLCRGKATENIPAPNCLPDFQDGQLVGCQGVSSSCNDASNLNDPSSSYCSTACRPPITCSPGTAANNYTKSSCASALLSTEPTCTSATDTLTAIEVIASCARCNAAMLAAATLPATTTANALDQCYSLESYKGKVDNIPDSLTQSERAVDTYLASDNAKGLTRLGSFSGRYGNIGDFSPSGNRDPTHNNGIYQLDMPLIFSKAGRLKFFVLDGDNFQSIPSTNTSENMQDSYDNNSPRTATYSGANGFELDITGTLEFSNGAWLQARLCKETNDSSIDCSTNTMPIPVSDPTHLYRRTAAQPALVDIAPPTASTTTSATVTSNYEFNGFGTLVRKSGSSIGDCATDPTGVDSIPGSIFYCHTYQYYTENELKAIEAQDASAGIKPDQMDVINTNIANLRLSFKILDPELKNCGPSSAAEYTGIRVKNPFYNISPDLSTQAKIDSHAALQGEMCAVDASGVATGPAETPGAGADPSNPNDPSCKKEFYCANVYYNNSGKYHVRVKSQIPASGNSSNFIGWVIKPILNVIDGEKDDPSTLEVESSIGQVERVYSLLIADSRYQAILQIALVTMFTFYGFGYLIGVVEMSHGDIISRIIKIGIIYFFVGESGWYWFDKIVVTFFKEGTDYLAFMMASAFDNSPELLDAIRNGNYYDKAILFSSVDRVFDLVFSMTVGKKISALLFASIFGWAYMWIIWMSFMLYVLAVSNAVLLYLTAQVFITVLLVLGPLFFIFTLFSQTKDMFDNWLKQLIGFSLQQIFLLTTLAFFNMMMYEVIKMSLGYRICWDDVWTLSLFGSSSRITLLSWWTIASLPPRTNAHSEVGNIGNPEGIPSLFTILFIWVIASLMKKFIQFMADLAASISGGLSASSLGSSVASFANNAKKQIGKAASSVADKTTSQVIRKLDKSLFDSGKLAEESRTKRRKQNSLDLKNRNSMAKAGDTTVSKYKTENATKLADMSQSDQRKKLNEVRNEGMTREGKKLGLKDEEIKKLKSDTGLKYVDTNVFGATWQALKQSRTKGQGLTSERALDNRKLDTKLSYKEGQKALKSMSPDERVNFSQSVKDGKINVEESNWYRAEDGAKYVGKSALQAAAALTVVGVAGQALHKQYGKEKVYDEAARQLTKEGKISDHRQGFGWTRDSSEKNLIRERARENVEERKTSKTSSGWAIADLERETRSLDKKEEIGNSNKWFKGIRKAATEAVRIMRDDNKSENINKDSTHGAAARNTQHREVDDGLSDLNNRRTSAEDSFTQFETQRNDMQEYKDLTALKKEPQEDMSSREKREHQGKMGRLERTIADSDAGIGMKEANAAMHQIDSRKENLEIRRGKLGEDPKLP
jgi:type IV secretory pathway VirB6-like protein